MARQPYFVDSNTKQMEVFGSFGGGMVTQPHPEKLNDDQSILLENVDIVEGGVVQARGAYAQTNAPNPSISGNTQGFFRYRKADGTYQDIVAINGNLYTVSGNTYTQLNISGLASFQTTRPIEAVQYRDKMYFATGSGLVVYDGNTASLVQAYAPNGLEALYIGTNALAANPDNYLSDTTGAANVILGVVPSQRYGIINQPVTFTAYVQKVASDTLEYQFETKLRDEPNYTVAQSWSTNKTFTTSFSKQADYMVRVSIRKQGQGTVLNQYVLPRYRVNTTPDENPEPGVNFNNISTCNRIFVHYDRLYLYGDTTNPDFLYISHLNKFDYFPRTNIVKVTDPLRGALQSVKQYKNFLVCFTNGSIQMITGTNPKEFTKQPIHTTLGTLYPYSVQVMKNYIVFVGNDNGVYILKSFNYASDDKMNVERIDDAIRDNIGGLIKTSTKLLSCIYNNQYFLYIENTGGNYVYRFYYELGVWVRDSVSMSFRTMNTIDNTVILTDVSGGIVYQLKYDVFKDGTNTPYNMHIVSKDYDFGMPHHRKKLKQYQILAKMSPMTFISVSIYTDNQLLTTSQLTYDPSQNTDAQKLKVMASGRFRYVKTDITIPVNERVQLIGFGFVFKQNTPK
jgi:hypothetical protein